MSKLADALRTWAQAQTGYSTYFTAIYPDTAPKGRTPAKLTYGVTKGTSRNPIAGLSGVPLSRTERIQVEITAATRSSAEASRDWLADQIGGSPSMVTAGSLLVRYWRVDDDGTEDDVDREDASDENLRTVVLDIVGAY